MHLWLLRVLKRLIVSQNNEQLAVFNKIVIGDENIFNETRTIRTNNARIRPLDDTRA